MTEGREDGFENRRQIGENEHKMVKSFLDLDVYQESLSLATEIHFLSKTLPKREEYLLAEQCLRASRGIPSLIAESWAKRRQVVQFKKYLRDSIGECNEMMNHIKQAELFGYIDATKAKGLIERYDALASRICKLKDTWRTFPTT